MSTCLFSGKSIVTIVVILFMSLSISAVTVPYSTSQLKTPENYFSDFVRVSPDDSLVAYLRTDVWVWHDSENLCLLLEAEIDDSFEEGRLADKDEMSNCDYLRVQIITDVENYYAYMFYAFPLGNKYDGIRKSNLNLDKEWDSSYKYYNSITDTLWTCSMNIPFKDLRFYGKAPHKWKIILTRYLQKEEDYYGVPFLTTSMGKDYFRKAIDVEINEVIPKNKNYRITPYFVKKYDLINKTDSFDPDNIGLDFSYNPTSATRVKVSLNPDYSDVPMDDVSNDFNIRYAPSFEENRYFFTEDLDVFGVSDNLFYSRNIMQPQIAVKITGNTEKYTYGIFTAMDKEVSEEGEILNSDDIYNMIAFKPKWRDLSIQTTLLNRMNKDYHNEVLVINPSWEFVKDHTIWGEFDFSLKKLPDSNAVKGAGLYLGDNGSYSDFEWSLTSSYLSKDYAVDMGELYETDYSSLNGFFSQRSEPDGRIIKDYGSSIWGHKTLSNEDWKLMYQNIGANIWADLPLKTNPSLSASVGQDEYNGSVFTWDSYTAGLGCSYISWLYLYSSYNIGHSLVYRLEDTYKGDNITLTFSGDISRYFSYEMNANRIRYFGFPSDSGMDTEYSLLNADVTINFSNTLSSTNGLRFNDYETSYSSANVGFFTNLRYEFKDNCNLFLGYKTSQDEIEQSYVVDYREAYMKVSYTF